MVLAWARKNEGVLCGNPETPHTYTLYTHDDMRLVHRTRLERCTAHAHLDSSYVHTYLLAYVHTYLLAYLHTYVQDISEVVHHACERAIYTILSGKSLRETAEGGGGIESTREMLRAGRVLDKWEDELWLELRALFASEVSGLGFDIRCMSVCLCRLCVCMYVHMYLSASKHLSIHQHSLTHAHTHVCMRLFRCRTALRAGRAGT
jgi:hypothetical protein